MKIAVITVAGLSSRFNEGIAENEKKLKCIYFDGDEKDTLLFHTLEKVSYADKIVVVGGYRFDDLKDYIDKVLSEAVRKKIMLVNNEHYFDLASGYSLYVGLNEAFDNFSNIEEVLFIEGDLDIDKASIELVINEKNSVLTYNNELIYSKSAVVLYQDKNDCFKYAFNSSHGMLLIDEPFKCILNSGQLWKFTDIDVLKKANEEFGKKHKEETNLKIIQDYIDRYKGKISLVNLKRWTNCNTRENYNHIKKYWEDER